VSCALVLQSQSPLQAAGLVIHHDPPACFVAEAFPRLTAQVEPAGQAARVRVSFRPEAASVWHGVAGQIEGDRVTALLPRPRLAAKRIHYHFEASGPDAVTVQSPEYAADVVADATACPGKVAESEASARVLVEVPPGAPTVPPVPPGFDPVGAVSATQRQAGGGPKLGLLLGIVGGAAAVGVGVAAGKNSSDISSTMPPPPGWQIVSGSPPSPSQISVSGNSMSITVSVIPPRTLASGTARVSFFANLSQPACAVLSGPNPPLATGVRSTFTLSTPFVTATPCGLTVSARIAFLDATGSEIVRSGTPDFLDASIMYTFVP
jgi:hypothetical protein